MPDDDRPAADPAGDTPALVVIDGDPAAFLLPPTTAQLVPVAAQRAAAPLPVARRPILALPAARTTRPATEPLRCARCTTVFVDLDGSVPIDGTGICRHCAGAEATRPTRGPLGPTWDRAMAATHPWRHDAWQWVLWHLPTLVMVVAAVTAGCLAGALGMWAGVRWAPVLVPAACALMGVVLGTVARPGPRPIRGGRHRADADTPTRTITPTALTTTTITTTPLTEEN